MLERIETNLRAGELTDPDAQLVVRGWPLNVPGIKNNAKATSDRYSYGAQPLVAVSSELTMPGHALDRILSGRRLRTRFGYAAAPATTVLAAGFLLLPTFDAPHYSIVWESYNDFVAERLLELLGPPLDNQYFVRRVR